MHMSCNAWAPVVRVSGSLCFWTVQAEGERLSVGLLLRHIENGCNIFTDLERELLQEKAASRPACKY